MNLWGYEDDGRVAASLLAALAEQGADFEIDVESFPPVLSQMMVSKTVRSARMKHRLAILGPVARMQSADRIILGGFNEGNWPPRPETDPGPMRKCAMLLGCSRMVGVRGSAPMTSGWRVVRQKSSSPAHFVTAMQPRRPVAGCSDLMLSWRR